MNREIFIVKEMTDMKDKKDLVYKPRRQNRWSKINNDSSNNKKSKVNSSPKQKKKLTEKYPYLNVEIHTEFQKY